MDCEAVWYTYLGHLDFKNTLEAAPETGACAKGTSNRRTARGPIGDTSREWTVPSSQQGTSKAVSSQLILLQYKVLETRWEAARPCAPLPGPGCRHQIRAFHSARDMHKNSSS
jgi:hypothetical protein